MIKEDYTYLKNYAKPCFTKKRDTIEKLPHFKEIQDFLQGDYSLEKVRDYFFFIFNLRNNKEDPNYKFHLVIPYQIEQINDSGIISSINEPFFKNLPIPLCTFNPPKDRVKKVQDLGILNHLTEGDIIITHALEIVDHCKKQDLIKYNYLYGR